MRHHRCTAVVFVETHLGLVLGCLIALGTPACAQAQGTLGDRWLTEGPLEPGLTVHDRVLHSFPIEAAEGWEVTGDGVRVETEESFYGDRCLRLSGPQNAQIVRECEFAASPLTYVTCAFRREVGATAEFMLRTDGGQWHYAPAGSGYYWTHGYQRALGRFTSFFFSPELKPGDEVVAVGFRAKGAADVLVDDLHVVEASSGYALYALLPRPSVVVGIDNPIPIEDFETEHPFINLTRDKLEARRKAYAENPATAAQVIDEADQAIAAWEGKKLRLPVGDTAVGASYYSCDLHPEVVLEFDPLRPDYRWCPKCEKNVINPRTTNAWIRKYAAWFFGQLGTCASAWTYTGDDRYAAEIRRRVLLFCQAMRDYPSVAFGAGIANVHWPLITCQAACLSAYDATYDSQIWSDADRETLQNYLAVPYGPPPKPGSYTGNYIGAGALLTLRRGLLFGDREVVYDAVNYRMGRTIQYLFDEDGMWREKTWGYHNMVLHGIRAAANLAQEHLGIDVYHHRFGDRSFKRAFEIWVKGSFPDGSLPLINDNRAGRKGGLNINSWLKIPYEIYGDPIFEPEHRPILDSMDLQGPGWAYLRSDTDSLPDQLVAVLDYGSQRGAGHGHSDTMQLIVWANGETIAPDLDVAEYVRYPYYYAPAAHNTMSPIPAEGQTRFFSDGPELKVVRAATRDPESAIQHARTVLMAADGAFLVDLFSARSAHEQDYLWHWHCPGAFTTQLGLSDYDELDMAKRGYATLENVQAAQETDAWEAQWRGEKQTATLRMVGERGTTVIAADGYGYLPTERMTMLAARRKAKETLFAGLFTAYRDQSCVKEAHPLDAGQTHAGWQVQTATGSYQFVAARTSGADEGEWAGGTTDGQVLAVALDSHGELRELVCLQGSRLDTQGVQVVEGSFSAVHLSNANDGVKLSYAGNGPLTLVVPWAAKSIAAENRGSAKLRNLEQGAALHLMAPGDYRISL